MKTGHRAWAIPGGRMPQHTTGPEPECTSNDELCLLNTGGRPAQVQVHIYHEDRDPVGPYRLSVEPARVRHVRCNDLIDPQAVPLDTPYAVLLTSDEPVVVMFLRKDTSQAANAILGTMAFPLD